MVVVDWLRAVRNHSSRTRYQRRNRNRQSNSLILVSPERCEDRILLSGTNTAADETQQATTPSDQYDSVDYFEIATDSPLGDELGSYESEYQEYQDGSQQSAEDAYGDAMESQDEYSSDPPGDSGQTDTGNGSGQDNTSDNGESGETGTGESTGEQSGQSFSEALQQLLSRFVADTNASTHVGEAPATGDNTAATDSENSTSPFDLPDHVVFDEIALPIQAFEHDLFSVSPEGTDTFETVTVTERVANAVAEGDQTPEPTDLAQTVLTAQEWNAADDWTITQSFTNEFTDSQPVKSEEGVEIGRGTRKGTETYTASVFGGTTAVRSYSLTDRRTYRDGSLHEADANDAQDSDAAEDGIPASWISSARASVTAEDSDTEGTGTDPATDGATGPTDSDDDSGNLVTSNTGLTVTVTETMITLDDGSPAVQKSVSMSWYASFSWGIEGSYSLDETESDELASTSSASDSSSSGADSGASGSSDSSSGDSATGGSTAPEIPDGMTIDSSGSYELFASGSIGGHFTVTTTVPTDATVEAPAAEISFGFAVTATAGGSSDSSLTVEMNVSSGDETGNTDEYEKVDISESTSASGMVGFSFWLAGPGDDSEDSGDTSAATASDASADIDGTSVPATDTERPFAGEKTAKKLLEENDAGIQLSLNTVSSYKSESEHAISEKNRERYSESTHFWSQSSSSGSESSNSDTHAVISFGTEEMLVDVGSTGSSSTQQTSGGYQWTNDLGMDPEAEAAQYGETAYSNSSESSHDFRFVLGGDDDVENKSEFSFDIDISASDTWHSTSYGTIEELYRLEEVYRDFSDDVEEQMIADGEEVPEKTYHKTEAHFGIIAEQSTQVPGADDSGDARSLDDILDEYRDRQTQVTRLEALLAETTDPEMRAYLSDVIETQRNILNTLHEEATAAGATAEQLATIDSEAGTAAAADPIELTEGDFGSSPTITAVTSFFDGVVDTFMDGRAFDSFLGATNQMTDVMTFDLFDFTGYGSFFGNEAAFEDGTVIGTWWARANVVAITFGRWAPPPGGAGSIMTHWGPAGMTAFRSGDWVMRGSPNLLRYLLSGVAQPGRHFAWPWNFITGRAAAGTLAAPPGWEAFKMLLGQRIYLP